LRKYWGGNLKELPRQAARVRDAVAPHWLAAAGSPWSSWWSSGG